MSSILISVLFQELQVELFQSIQHADDLVLLREDGGSAKMKKIGRQIILLAKNTVHIFK